MNNGLCYEDILGFTKQTETLITGLGGTPELVEEFRKRNISNEELSELHEYDLIALGKYTHVYFQKPFFHLLNLFKSF